MLSLVVEGSAFWALLPLLFPTYFWLFMVFSYEFGDDPLIVCVIAGLFTLRGFVFFILHRIDQAVL